MKTGTSKSFLVRAAMLLLGVLTMTTAMADRQPPVYNIEVCKGGIGEVYIRGWAYDPNQRDQEIQLYITIETALENDPDYDWISTEDYPEAIIRVYREDVNSAHNLTTGNHGFQIRFPLEPSYFGVDVANTFYVKIYARTFEYNPSNPNHDDYQFQLNDQYTAVTVVNKSGDGTAESPCLVCDATHWDTMADVLADEDLASLYDGGYYQMYEEYNQWTEGYNITTPVTKMWGTSNTPFTGHFDGNGQTVNVNISSADPFVAPFASVNGASIHDLSVTGTVNGSMYVGGIVGRAAGTLSLQNCVCSTNISGSPYYAAGLVGWCEDLTMKLQNCLFKGSFSLGSGGYCHHIALKNARNSCEINGNSCENKSP